MKLQHVDGEAVVLLQDLCKSLSNLVVQLDFYKGALRVGPKRTSGTGPGFFKRAEILEITRAIQT